MTVYYVSTTGNNGSNGSSAAPWKTISYAMQQNLKAGDTVLVRPGTYTEQYGISMKAGSAAGDITLKSEVPGAALIRTDAYAAVYLANYTTVEGFDVKAGTHGIFGNGVHHVTARGNIAHDSGLSGISVMWGEFITIEGNETYGNAYADWGSGITVWEPRNITGDTTTQGYRTIVRNNVSHDNVQKAGYRTDGNGIIIDDFHHGQNSGWPNYTYPTLVDGNIVYHNGGKGIAVHWSDNVTVSNNTAWHNNRDNGNTTTWRGEFSQQDSANNVWVNNIAVADTSTNPNNTAIGFYGGNSNTKWYNNITFNGTPGQASQNLQGGNNPPLTAANGNQLGVNPLFVDPANGDFHVQPGSPAIDAGTAAYGLGSTDAAGNPRVVGTVDIGAYERGGGGTGNQAPVANDDSGYSTQMNNSLTIGAASLLANDTDANNDTLSVTAVGSAVHGSVSLNANGAAVFTPEAGYTGAAGFSYTISDGHGGQSSADVSITVGAATTNAAPVFTSGASYSLNENTTAAGKLTAQDAENDTLTYAKAGGTDAALFAVNKDTGAITFLSAPDFEKPGDANKDNIYALAVSVTDGTHAAVTKTLNITVKDVFEGTSGGSNFFGPAAKPAQTKTSDPTDYELGMKFKPVQDGEITALRYFRGAADSYDTNTRTLHLWSGGGTELASVKITSAPGASGWQTAYLSAPVDVVAGKTYVASYGTTQNYAFTEYYFGQAMTNADATLRVPAGADGVFTTKGPGFFPTSTWHASNYWVDVAFKPEPVSSTMAIEALPSTETLLGTGKADRLAGGVGDDVINGRGGNDRLIGGRGGDDLSGGGGSDVFVYHSVSQSTPANADTIRDFVRGTDKIDLSAIDAVTGGTGDAFVWIGRDAFDGKAGELRAEQTDSGLLLQGDINGDGRAEIQIELIGAYHTLFAHDLIL